MYSSPRAEDNFVPTQNDIEDYTALKSVLGDKLKKEGSLFVAKKSGTGYVGLTNQGATLYLNSVLQSLYNITEFKNSLFNCKGNAPMIKEFQKLFAFLRLSDACVTSTSGITATLGWNSVEFFEGKNAEEILALLFDALGNEDSTLKTDLGNTFQGKKRDIMICGECKGKSENPGTFTTVPLDILEAADSLEESADRMLAGLTLSRLMQTCAAGGLIKADETWTCPFCSKASRATKSVEYNALPTVLTVHLKRFHFDPVTRRKVKLSHPILFTDTLEASAVMSGAEGHYKLQTIMLHSGPSMGGQYKAIVKDRNNNWFEFDDYNITAFESADLASLFWYNGQNSNSNYSHITDLSAATDLLYESAYMLVFVKDGAPAIPTDVVPTSLEKEVSESNTLLAKLRDAYRVHKQMAELKIFVVPLSGDASGRTTEDFTLFLPRTTTVQEATSTAFTQAKASSLGVTDLDKCRLRRFDAATGVLGETFGRKEQDSLLAVSMYPSSILALETRTDDQVFEDFNPNLMLVRLMVWDGVSKPNVEKGRLSGRVVKVVVPGESCATVGALRAVAASALGCNASQIALVRADHTTMFEMSNDAKTLRQDYNLWPGEEIILEILPDNSTYTSTEPSVMIALRSGTNNIRIFFNNPSAGSVTSVENDYDPTTMGSPRRNEYPHHIDVSLETTLADVRVGIGRTLGIDANSFHIRKSATEPQLKDYSRTMQECELSNNSVLHLQVGAGCELGEHLLRLEVDRTPDSAYITEPSDIVLLGDVAVREKATVAQVKALILEKWDALVAGRGIAKPESVAHMKIRDGKGQASASLRDERSMSRALLNMQDGRKLVVQVLPTPVVVTATDTILCIRLASYGCIEGGPEKGLSRVMEAVVSKSSTVQQLFEILAAKFPFLQEAPSLTLVRDANDGDSETLDLDGIADSLQPLCRQIAISKALTSSAGLSLREYMQKLRWNDKQMLGSNAELCKEPVNLRDGSVIVVRGQADFLRAKVLGKQRKEAGIDEPLPARPGSRGAVRPGSRSAASRPRSRGVAARAKPVAKANLLADTGDTSLPNAPSK